MTRMTIGVRLAGAVFGTVVLGTTAVWAQGAAGDSRACAPDVGPHLSSPDTPVAKPDATTGSGGTLSDKLARSDGVICPPDVDPDIKAPAPGGGKTPVIPPPGTPGGDPNIQPK